MVTEEKALNTAALRYRLGTILIWVGVFTWMPFIFLRVVGESPPFLLFLPFHLIGVIGGSRLRALARKQLVVSPPGKSALLIAGRIMIVSGILVWVPYLYLKLAPGTTAEVSEYLPYHLAGVLGGVFLQLLNHVVSRSLMAKR